jgi:hypothetical protein
MTAEATMSELEQVSLTIGGLLARTERLEKDVQEIMKGQKEIIAILNTAKGSWKTMVAISGFWMALGGAIVGLVSFWSNIKQIFGK